MFKTSKNSVREKFEAESLQHLDALYRSALGLVRNPDDAEDLVQDTYLKAYRFYGGFEPGTNLKAWLLKIQFNTFVNRYRRVNRERSALKELAEEGTGYGMVSEAAARGLTDAVGTAMWPIVSEEIKSAIEKLPEDYRMIIVLADVEELTYREIADVVGCPIGTVMSRLHRARGILKERLVEHARNRGFSVATNGDTEVEEKADSDPVSLDLYRRERGAK
jgi:RNA polymerase sigma-70 factor, ECF subfamily